LRQRLEQVSCFSFNVLNQSFSGNFLAENFQKKSPASCEAGLFVTIT
jgi:hypothetical protein